MELNLYRYYTKEGKGTTIGYFADADNPKFPLAMNLARPLVVEGKKNNRDNPKTKTNESTCIPAGEYILNLKYSPKFKRNLYEIMGVPGRKAILIHACNFVSELLGCEGVGNRIISNVKHFNNIEDFILSQGESRAKEDYLMKYLQGQKTVKLSIIDNQVDETLKILKRYNNQL